MGQDAQDPKTVYKKHFSVPLEVLEPTWERRTVQCGGRRSEQIPPLIGDLTDWQTTARRHAWTDTRVHMSSPVSHMPMETKTANKNDKNKY